MKHPIERERGQRYVGLPEFVRVSGAILSELAIQQGRGTVSLVPDERTIRYYLAEGLIQPADEKQGTASVFGYRHLLQLVAVKKLQAEHLPIKKIRELVADKDEQHLESLLGVTDSPRMKADESEAKRYLESLLEPSMSLSSLSPSTRESIQRRVTKESVQAPSQAAPEQTASWQRVEIEPGLELHIRSDYLPPPTSSKSRGLADKIRSLLKAYWRAKE